MHGFGIEDATIPDLGCDFFSAGTHKWIFGPRGTGILWGRAELWPEVVPMIPAFGRRNDAAGGVHAGRFQSFEHRWAADEGSGSTSRSARRGSRSGSTPSTADSRRTLEAGPRRSSNAAVDELASGIVCFDVKGKTPSEVISRFGAKKSRGQRLALHAVLRAPGGSLWNTPEQVDLALKAIAELGIALSRRGCPELMQRSEGVPPYRCTPMLPFPLLVTIAALPTIWIVDAANGPGTNFVDLPPAIAAAASGDTIIVRAGNYSAFNVSGKALTIRGAGAAAAHVFGLGPGAPSNLGTTIDTVPAGSTFYVSGLSFAGFHGVPPPILSSGLGVLGASRVVVTDAIITGPGITTAAWNYAGAGLVLSGGAEVHVSRTTMQGAGTGAIAGTVSFGGLGRLRRERVHVASPMVAPSSAVARAPSP